MIPEELMIGDILEYMGTIVKVYSIGAKICVKECFAKNTYIVDFDNLLKGLELTPEILKKNGFTGGEYKSYTGDVWYLKAEGFRKIGLTMSRKESTLWGEKIKPLSPDSIGHNFAVPTIKFVHELQHALKLCGINKEIEV